ncbi:MAG: phytanoyl-CoA dioxygenase family protein [Chloroflexota bacterium]
MTLTHSELSQFHEQGYVVKPGVYTHADLQPIKDAIMEMIDTKARDLHKAGELKNIHEQESFEARLARIRDESEDACKAVTRHIMGKGGGGYSGPAILGMLRHQPLLACIESIVGPDIIGSSVYRIRPKLPGWARGEVPWHQDSGYLLAHCDQHLIVTCWVPLVDVDEENGCLYVLPNSHRKGIIRHYTGGHGGFLEIAGEDLPSVEPIPIPMKAGGVLFMTNLTPHASFENKTDLVRWSVDLRYQGMLAPNNIDEDPATYVPEREPVTMACHPTEADFVLRDTTDPEREIRTPEQFYILRERYEKVRPYSPGRGWTSLKER